MIYLLMMTTNACIFALDFYGHCFSFKPPFYYGMAYIYRQVLVGSPTVALGPL